VVVLRLNRKILLIVALILLASSPVWVPAAVFAVKGEYDKFQYYLEALKAMLNGLVEYFKAVIELFKEAVKP
jgi:regulator of protease activity HflC (stomatin/prohibitin superfamily)